MSNKIYLKSTFSYREDTLENWQIANPVLERGEISFVRDGYDGKFVKIGDGVSLWNSLPFAPLPKGEQGKQGEKGDKGEKGEKGEKGQDAVTDQTYSPTSENAQSGKAVAEAIASIDGGSSEKEWELLEDITLTESVSAINLPIDKINTKNEVHIEGYVVPTDTTITNQVFQFNDGNVLWQTNVSCKATGKIYVVMDICKSPRGRPIFDGTVSAYAYTLSGANFKTTQIDSDLSVINSDNLINSNQFLMRTTAANPMTIGTRVKVWGR